MAHRPLNRCLPQVTYMKRSVENETELRQINYEIFIIIITLLSWLNFILFSLFSGDMNLRLVIIRIELILTPVLLIDFFVRLRKADPHRAYFVRNFGWLDLIGSFPFLGLARVYRVFHVGRTLTTYGSKRIFREFFSNRAETAVLTIFLAVILLFEFASIAILKAESHDPNATIQTAEDAFWWVLVTISTVGYGDLTPVTERGRLIGSLVIVAGVGLFGVMSGFLARNFLGERSEEDIAADEANLHELAELKKLMIQIQADQEKNQREHKQTIAALTEQVQRLHSMLEQQSSNPPKG